MNLFWAIIVTVVHQAALHWCRPEGEALVAVDSAEPPREPASAGLGLADVPAVALAHSYEDKHYSFVKKDESRTKMHPPREEREKTDGKQMIELLPLRHKRKGKTVAYILAPGVHKKAFRALINGQFEIGDKEENLHEEDDSGATDGSTQNLYNEFDETVDQDGSLEYQKGDFVNMISKESNSNAEVSRDPNSDIDSHYLDDDSDGDSELHYLKIHNLHHKLSLDDSSDEYDVDDTEHIKNNLKFYSDESSSSPSDGDDDSSSDDNSPGDEKSQSVESDYERDSSRDDLVVEWNGSQENSLQVKKDTIDASQNVILPVYSDETTTQLAISSEQYINEEIDSDSEIDRLTERITEMKRNDYKGSEGSHEEVVMKRNHECDRRESQRSGAGGKGGRPRAGRRRLGGHRSYSLSFLFHR